MMNPTSSSDGSNFTKCFVLEQALKEKELGNNAYKNKDFESALKHYEEAIKHDPTNMTYLSNQAGRKPD